MRKLLNRFAIWLYKNTDTEKHRKVVDILSGIHIIESPFLAKGKCLMGTGDINELRDAYLYESINTPQQGDNTSV